ncbi:MAG: hypothetical protein IKH18_04870 [Clostridia bacterium]|nr:hypothetical protein [Clostridia bacterium]
MDEKRIRGLMGLCVRAGQATFGEERCLKDLRSGQCGLLLLDAGISKSAEERYQGICEREGIPMKKLPEGWLEEATGRPGMAMAVRAGGFAEQMAGCL